MKPNSKLTKMKICGIRDVDTLQLLCKQHVDYIGFIFAASRRQVEAKQVASWLGTVGLQPIQTVKDSNIENERPQTVGVFMNQSKEEIVSVLENCSLDVIQLHGQETAELCRWLKKEYAVQIFKVFSVTAAMTPEEIVPAFEPYLNTIDMLMLDTYDAKVGGGSGEAFNWKVIPQIKQWSEQHNLPLMIAGGLHEQNIEELVIDYQPFAIDVSSGVETDGDKDHDKIKSFVERVKSL